MTHTSYLTIVNISSLPPALHFLMANNVFLFFTTFVPAPSKPAASFVTSIMSRIGDLGMRSLRERVRTLQQEEISYNETRDILLEAGAAMNGTGSRETDHPTGSSQEDRRPGPGCLPRSRRRQPLLGPHASRARGQARTATLRCIPGLPDAQVEALTCIGQQQIHHRPYRRECPSSKFCIVYRETTMLTLTVWGPIHSRRSTRWTRVWSSASRNRLKVLSEHRPLLH